MNKFLEWGVLGKPVLLGLLIVNIIVGISWMVLWLDHSQMSHQLSALQHKHQQREIQQQLLNNFQQRNLADPLSAKALKQQTKRLAKEYTLALKIKQVLVNDYVLQLSASADFWMEEDWFAWLTEIQKLPGMASMTQMSIHRVSDRTEWPFRGEVVLLCQVA